MSVDEAPEPLEPLDPSLAGLFAAERVPSPSAEAHARVRNRIAASIAVGSLTPNAAAAAAKRIAVRSLSLASATFVAGAVLGGGIVFALRTTPPPRLVYIDRPIQSASASAMTAVPTSESPREPSAPSSFRASPPAPSASAPDGDTLGIERSIIDDARSRLASGGPEAALRRLDEHARRFPKGRLAEEREALAIQALANAEKPLEARARAKAFRERWPTSVYGPAVDATMRSIP